MNFSYFVTNNTLGNLHPNIFSSVVFDINFGHQSSDLLVTSRRRRPSLTPTVVSLFHAQWSFARGDNRCNRINACSSTGRRCSAAPCRFPPACMSSAFSSGGSRSGWSGPRSLLRSDLCSGCVVLSRLVGHDIWVLILLWSSVVVKVSRHLYFFKSWVPVFGNTSVSKVTILHGGIEMCYDYYNY